MYRNILVPYDKSEAARSAVVAAVKLASEEEEASITVLNVSDAMDLDDATFEVAARIAGIPPISDEDAHAARENYLDFHKKELKDDIEGIVDELPDGVQMHLAVVSGHPQESIRDYAGQGDFDCIVMGRRGLGAIRGALGSVSYSVLRSVDLPVLIVK